MNTPTIIDGNKVSREIFDELKSKVSAGGIVPGLALILAGNDSSSEIYVKMKAKRCAELGYYSVTERLPETATGDDILALIEKFNKDERIHGILVQLPLPAQINEMNVLEAVDYRKDVDGFHPINAGRLMIGEKCFVPCTPAGIVELMKRYNVKTSGANTVVIGRSNIVGKPIANLMLQKNEFANSTVTICHSATKDITEHTRNADIIIAAIGKPGYLKGDMIKQGCVIIDVGINRVEDTSEKKGYKIYGDVDFNSCAAKASMITPVPGGVGPMTIAMLLKSTYESALKMIYPK